MTDSEPTIEQQLSEVRAVRLSREAWLRQRQLAVSQGREVPPDTGCCASSIEPLLAAERTLEAVRDYRNRQRDTRSGDAA